MKQCRHCGFFNPDDNQFCVNCGKTLDGPAHKGGFPVKAVLIILLSIAVIGLVVLFIRKPSWLPFGTKTVGVENDTEKEPFPETADPGDSPGETEIGEDNDDPAIDPETDEDPDAPLLNLKPMIMMIIQKILSLKQLMFLTRYLKPGMRRVNLPMRIRRYISPGTMRIWKKLCGDRQTLYGL